MGLVQSTGLWYSFYMIKSVVISGIDYPATASLVQSALNADKNVLVSVSDNDEEVQTPSNGARPYVWHKSSPISSRSMLLEAENTFGSIDCCFVVFDTEVFFSKYKILSLENISHGNDEMLISVQYLVYELMKRFTIQKSGLLCFVLNPLPSLADSVLKNREVSDSLPVSALTAAAEAGFRCFAENIAASSTSLIDFDVLMVEQKSEAREDLADWLISFTETYSNAEKKFSSKDVVKWLHIGAKQPSSHSFFKH